MTRIRTLAAGAVMVLATSVAAAQAITFYESEGFGGQRFSERNAVANFEQFGFNDRASSVVIESGRWQLCSDAYFRGRCVTLNPGQYNDLNAMGLSNRVSSARQVNGGAGGPPPGQGYRPPGGGYPQPGQGAALTLFDQDHMNGASAPVQAENPNLDSTQWNDRAVSMIITYGSWELCSDAYFRGDCRTFGPGRYDNLGGMTRKVSSLRPAGGAPPPPSGPAPQSYPQNWGGSSRAILYEGANLSGRDFVLAQDYMPNLDGTQFNDRALSLRVEGGYWMFCTDANFRGDCRTFGPGDYPTLPGGMQNRISSGRRISNDYPYNRNPDWNGRN